MSRRILVAALLTTLVVGTTAAAVRAGDDARTPQRGLTLERVADIAALQPVRGTSGGISKCEGANALRCINRNFKRVLKAHNRLVGFIGNCFAISGVSQWGDPSGSFGTPNVQGYFWDEDGNGSRDYNTSALDFDSGPTPDLRVLHLVC